MRTIIEGLYKGYEPPFVHGNTYHLEFVQRGSYVTVYALRGYGEERVKDLEQTYMNMDEYFANWQNLEAQEIRQQRLKQRERKHGDSDFS